MADPVSVTGLVLQVGVLLKQLVEYYHVAKGAHSEIQSIRTDLYALKGVLDDIGIAQDDAGKRPLKRDLAETLTTAAAILSELAQKLDNKSHRKLKSLVWPFEKPECNEMLGRLERLKSWLVLYSMGEHQAGLGSIQVSLQDLTNIVQHDISERKSRLQLEQQQALLHLLASPSSDAVHVKACSAWQGNTPGAWFLDGHLQSWLSEEHPANNMLLLCGVSGSGKTVLMSRAAEWAKSSCTRDVSSLVARHYCLYNDETTQNVTHVLGSLVAQLAQRTPSILDHLNLEPSVDTQPEIAQLETCIASAGSGSQVIILVDALNESTDRNAVWQSLVRIAASGVNIRIIVSSTPGASDFTDDNATYVQVTVAAHRSIPDMAHFIDERTSQSKVLQRLPRSGIKDALLERAHGSFRWLQLQMKHIATQSTPKRAMHAIESTPATLDAAHAAIFARIPRDSREIVREALAWVACAIRPLTLEELNEAVVIEFEQQDMDDTCRLVPQDLLLNLCQGIFDLDLSTSTVTFAHQSVLTYLTSHGSMNANDAFWHLNTNMWSSVIVRKCLTYLLMQPFKRCATRRYLREEVRDLYASYPFAGYASMRWLFHVGECRSLGTQDLQLVAEYLETYRPGRYKASMGSFGYTVLNQDLPYRQPKVRISLWNHYEDPRSKEFLSLTWKHVQLNYSQSPAVVEKLGNVNEIVSGSKSESKNDIETTIAIESLCQILTVLMHELRSTKDLTESQVLRIALTGSLALRTQTSTITSLLYTCDSCSYTSEAGFSGSYHRSGCVFDEDPWYTKEILEARALYYEAHRKMDSESTGSEE
ncbi:hypothetical protein B0A48_10924 [Cryoendolithus antarcticus]|uniref:NACHT domain-containing protein n=1 Tax=Cryoendolithus antarcticus TaxID=1507870 RepID=A0A1V8SYS6_9PEZI|nr:hypothetical protein B0A48_10924 [Cryoendolithus antarcticus]